MKNFNWGIIGTGNIAKEFADDLKLAKSANHNLSAVLSYKKEKAAEFAEENGATKYFDSIHEFVKYAKIDAVYIATPHPMHHKETLICLNNKIPVLCEKPMAMNVSQVKEMCEASAANSTFLMEGMWIRFLPTIGKILELIDKGSIGKINSVEATLSFKAPGDPDNRFFNPDRGGGSLLDLGIYPLYLAQLVFGEPVSIGARAKLSAQKVDEECIVHCTYKHGESGFAASSLITQLANSATIKGDNGTIFIPAQWNEKPPELKVNYNDGNFISFPCSWEGRGFQFEIDEVLECIEEGKTESKKMPLKMSIGLAATMDEIRNQTGIIYPFD